MITKSQPKMSLIFFPTFHNLFESILVFIFVFYSLVFGIYFLLKSWKSRFLTPYKTFLREKILPNVCYNVFIKRAKKPKRKRKYRSNKDQNSHNNNDTEIENGYLMIENDRDNSQKLLDKFSYLSQKLSPRGKTETLNYSILAETDSGSTFADDERENDESESRYNNPNLTYLSVSSEVINYFKKKNMRKAEQGLEIPLRSSEVELAAKPDQGSTLIEIQTGSNDSFLSC